MADASFKCKNTWWESFQAGLCHASSEDPRSAHQSLQDVFRATVEAKQLYAAPAWSGFCTAADRVRSCAGA